MQTPAKSRLRGHFIPDGFLSQGRDGTTQFELRSHIDQRVVCGDTWGDDFRPGEHHPSRYHNLRSAQRAAWTQGGFTCMHVSPPPHREGQSTAPIGASMQYAVVLVGDLDPFLGTDEEARTEFFDQYKRRAKVEMVTAETKEELDTVLSDIHFARLWLPKATELSRVYNALKGKVDGRKTSPKIKCQSNDTGKFHRLRERPNKSIVGVLMTRPSATGIWTKGIGGKTKPIGDRYRPSKNRHKDGVARVWIARTDQLKRKGYWTDTQLDVTTSRDLAIAVHESVIAIAQGGKIRFLQLPSMKPIRDPVYWDTAKFRGPARELIYNSEFAVLRLGTRLMISFPLTNRADRAKSLAIESPVDQNCAITAMTFDGKITSDVWLGFSNGMAKGFDLLNRDRVTNRVPFVLQQVGVPIVGLYGSGHLLVMQDGVHTCRHVQTYHHPDGHANALRLIKQRSVLPVAWARAGPVHAILERDHKIHLTDPGLGGQEVKRIIPTPKRLGIADDERTITPIFQGTGILCMNQERLVCAYPDGGLLLMRLNSEFLGRERQLLMTPREKALHEKSVQEALSYLEKFTVPVPEDGAGNDRKSDDSSAVEETVIEPSRPIDPSAWLGE